MKKKLPDTLGEKYKILASPNDWQQVCNRWNPEKPIEIMKGRILADRTQKPPEP